MMKTYLFIWNPMAGGGKINRMMGKITERFEAEGCRLIQLRIQPGVSADAFLDEHCREADGIIIAGGDGTVNLLLNMIIRKGIKLPVGILPTGTANAFACALAPLRTWRSSVDCIIEGNTIHVDVGEVNGRYFINECSAGLFTSVSQQADAKIKKRWGGLAYIIAALKQLVRFRPVTLRVTHDGCADTLKALLFLVFNGKGVRLIDRIAYKSESWDGLLDVVIFKDCSFARAVILFIKILAGCHLEDKHVLFFQTDHVLIEKLDGACDLPDVDGEPAPDFPLDIRCDNKEIQLFYKK